MSDTPTPPASVIAKAMAPGKAEVRSKPAAERQGEKLKGWQLRAIKDRKEDVIAAVNGALTVPSEAKAMLVAAINDNFPNAKLIRLDAICQVLELPNGKRLVLGHWDVTEF